MTMAVDRADSATDVDVDVDIDVDVARLRGGRARRWVLALGLWAAVWSSRTAPGVPVLIIGDVILIGMCVIGVVSRRGKGWHRRLIRLLRGPAGLFLLSFALTTLLNGLSPAFDHIELLRSCAKLSLYLVAFSIIGFFASTARTSMFVDQIRLCLRVLLLVSIAQQLASALDVEVGLLSTYASGPWDRSAFPRSASLFTEPAYLSIFVVVSAVLLYRLRSLRWHDAITALTLLALAGSLTGLALAVLAVATIAISSASGRELLRAGAAVGLVVVALLVSPAGQVFNDRVVVRLEQTLAGEGDASSNARLVDGWLVAGTVLDERPLIGRGGGQLPLVLDEVSRKGTVPGLDERAVQSGGLWNVFANVLIEGGLLSLIPLTLFVLTPMVRWWPAAVLAVAVGFSTGTFFGWLWWLAIGMLRFAASTREIASPRATSAP